MAGRALDRETPVGDLLARVFKWERSRATWSAPTLRWDVPGVVAAAHDTGGGDGGRNTHQLFGATRVTEPDALLGRLLAKDETAFKVLVKRHHRTMVCVAYRFVGNCAIAEEVAQDTWLAVIGGLARFDGRSTLKNWIFGILADKARTRAQREGRTASFSDFADDPPAIVDLNGFGPDGRWAEPPVAWEELDPERIVAGRQLMARVADLVDGLPAAQRSVVMLRDFEGLGAEEACRILDISAANQRVLLHRGRSRIRNGLAAHLARPADRGQISWQQAI